MSQIDEAVNRFLAWRLPEHFRPDCYVTFDHERAKKNNGWPVGTNLLTAEQARAMFEYCLAHPAPAAATPELVKSAPQLIAAMQTKLRNAAALIRGVYADDSDATILARAADALGPFVYWDCETCKQRNSWWATNCGRCGNTRDLPKERNNDQSGEVAKAAAIGDAPAAGNGDRVATSPDPMPAEPHADDLVARLNKAALHDAWQQPHIAVQTLYAQAAARIAQDGERIAKLRRCVEAAKDLRTMVLTSTTHTPANVAIVALDTALAALDKTSTMVSADS